MPDFDEIERVLRRYDFGLPQKYPAAIFYRTNAASEILEDAGYTVSALPLYRSDTYTSQMATYFVEIDGRTIHSGIDELRLIGFAYDLCNDYKDRDMAALVEYVKHHQNIEMTLHNSHGVAAQMAEAANESTETIDDLAVVLRLQSLSDRVEQLERAGKCKDAELTVDKYDACGGPIYGSGSVTISSLDGASLNIEGRAMDSALSSNWFSDNVARWSSVSTTPEVWLERGRLVAAISRRANQWTLQADEAKRNGRMKHCKHYRAIANALMCLADDIESGNYANE